MFPLQLNILESLPLYLFVLQRKNINLVAFLQLFKKSRVFMLEVHIINCIHAILWHGILVLCLYHKNWTLMNVKKTIRNLNGTDSAELNQFCKNASLTFFGRLSFQVQIEKKHMPFTVSKLNTVHTGVFTY